MKMIDITHKIIWKSENIIPDRDENDDESNE